MQTRDIPNTSKSYIIAYNENFKNAIVALQNVQTFTTPDISDIPSQIYFIYIDSSNHNSLKKLFPGERGGWQCKKKRNILFDSTIK